MDNKFISLNTSNIVKTLDKLNISDGGTNITSYIKGDLLYSNVNDQLTKLPLGTNNKVLTSLNNVPIWKELDLSLDATIVEENEKKYLIYPQGSNYYKVEVEHAGLVITYAVLNTTNNTIQVYFNGTITEDDCDVTSFKVNDTTPTTLSFSQNILTLNFSSNITENTLLEYTQNVNKIIKGTVKKNRTPADNIINAELQSQTIYTTYYDSNINYNIYFN